MKKIALLAALAALTATPTLSQAAAVNAGFSVTVTFTPACTVTAATGVIAFGNYTAFGPAISNIPVSSAIALTCSRGIGATATAAYGETGASGVFATSNLRYTLSAPAKSFSATSAGTPATGVSGGTIGSPDALTFNFSGTLPTQAGAGSSSAPLASESEARTLVVTF